jgi:Family of unknown function (DUF6636)
MKIAKLLALTLASAATALPLAAFAHACGNGPPDMQFKSPSGNIVCDLAVNLNGAAHCEIRNHAWSTPVSSYTGKPCDFTFGGQSFNLFPGEMSKVSCFQGASSLDSPRVETLDYGQTRSMGTIMCDSEPSGMTCTDSSTGHFFRLSSESYQLG